jgi:hypothetical protein
MIFGGQQYARSQMMAKFLVTQPFFQFLVNFWALGFHYFAKKWDISPQN